MLDSTDYQKRVAEDVAARYRVAVAADAVQIVPRGLSGLPQPVWDGKALIYPEFKGKDGKEAVKAMTAHRRHGPNRRRGSATSPETMDRRDKLAAMHARGATDAEVAAALGVSSNVIAADRRFLGLACNAAPRKVGPSEQTQIRMARYLAMKAAGATRDMMKADMGLTDHMLINLVRLTGSPLPRVRREKAPRSEGPQQMRPQEVRAAARREKLRAMIANGDDRLVIMAALNVRYDTLRRDVGILGLALPPLPVVTKVTSRDRRLEKLKTLPIGEKTVDEWAKEFGVIAETMRQDLRQLGLRAKPALFGNLGQRAVVIADKKQRLAALVAAGKTRDEIIAELRIGKCALQKYLRQMGLRIRRVRAPSAAPRALPTATLELRDQILALFKQGLRQIDIAERLAKNRGVICYHMRKMGLRVAAAKGGR